MPIARILRKPHETILIGRIRHLLVYTYSVVFKLFLDGGRYHIETSPLICRAYSPFSQNTILIGVILVFLLLILNIFHIFF